MDTEKTLDLNKPLFSYSRYERNEYGYGDDFIHRDGDGVDMQVFFNQATGEFVSKGVSISDFTNLVEGKSARDTNAWTRHSLDPKELLPDDISKVEINDGMMAFLKTYVFIGHFPFAHSHSYQPGFIYRRKQLYHNTTTP